MLQSVASSSCGRLIQSHKSTWYFVFLVLGYILYLIFGAVVFSSVELPYEAALRQELMAMKTQFLRDNECITEESLERFLREALDASNYGVSILNNTATNWNWDFTSALFFTSTVLSTTGYGHTAPLSKGGKAFCIIYSAFGIPFTLLFLTAVVQRIMLYSTKKPISYVHTRWGLSKPMVAIIHSCILALLAVTCIFLIPAAIFSALEDNWNFLESFYFCFISLSTIGLGDYVPGEAANQRFRKLYKLGITVYLILGLIVMLVVLETFCELQQLKQLRKMFYLKKEKTQDRLAILEHDQLSFTTAPDRAHSDDKVHMFIGVSSLSASSDDFMIQ